VNKKEVFINMENEIFRGNLLDVGLDNYGIVYNIYKEFNHEINVEYVSGEDEGKYIKEDYYDLCILLFSFSTIWSQVRRKMIIEKIHRCLNKDGLLYIWDIDKKIGKIFNGDIKILIPGKRLKKIKIRDFNIIQNSSKENTLNIIRKYFDVEEYNFTEDIYYIKAKNRCEKQELKEVSITDINDEN
jgi:hypothetical protein